MIKFILVISNILVGIFNLMIFIEGYGSSINLLIGVFNLSVAFLCFKVLHD
jgi:hypothetical protein